MTYKAFHAGWWEQVLYPDLCELWVFSLVFPPGTLHILENILNSMASLAFICPHLAKTYLWVSLAFRLGQSIPRLVESKPDNGTYRAGLSKLAEASTLLHDHSLCS